ncbi:Putative membrane spanning protein [Flavobacterium psychrophilum]|nr:Putative membrane spanning protein [Flavobacterium psychrophilum]
MHNLIIKNYNFTMFYLLDIIGTMAFAMSGALTAMNKKMDPFGVFIIAFVTALGGGTLRDVMIGNTPVGWMKDLKGVYAIIVAFLLAFLFRNRFDKLRTSLFLFDTIGLGVFTLIGIQKGINIHLHPVICVAVGTMTACFGGVIRDILCNEIPVIFRKEIYATICIIGGIFFFVLKKLNFEDDLIYIMTSLIIVIIRLMAVKFKWSLKPIVNKS